MTAPQFENPDQMVLGLPHFKHDVPILIGPDGLHYTPVFVLCRMLGLDATEELHRAQHVLFWSQARLLPLEYRERRYHAWCLPFTLSVTHWYGFVYRRVKDPQRRAQLDRAIDDAMQVSEIAYEAVQARFEDGRRRMYRLANDVLHLEELLSAVSKRPPRIRPGDEEAFRHIMDHFQLLAEQSGTFARTWLAKAMQLPVVDGIMVDDEGHVLDSSVPMTLLGSISDADVAQLEHYEQHCAQAQQMLNHLLSHTHE